MTIDITQKPGSIFKYVDLKTADLIVSSSSLMFSHPSSFNDPFDCNIDLLYFDLTDPHERVIKDLEKLDELFKHIPGYQNWTDKSSREELYRHSQLEKIERSSVSCFSLRVDNTLLWSYYSDKHTGICLQFNNDQVNRFANVADNEFSECIVTYDAEPINYCADPKEGIRKLFMSKSSDWQHEQEFRLLFLKPAGPYKFNKHFLVAVYFGLRMRKYEVRCFIEHCKEVGYDHLKYYQAVKNKLSIEFKELA